MCLPRFNSSGFLYAYTNCLDPPSKLTVILLSSHNTTDQFQILRAASQRIRESLNLPSVSDSILTIVKDDILPLSSTPNTIGTDVGWKRTSESFDNSTTDEGYVNISTEMIRHDCSIDQEGELLRQVRQSLELSSLKHICNQYLEDEHSSVLLHFLFRLNVPIESIYNRKKPPGYLSQCISPTVTSHFESPSSRRQLWRNYFNLSYIGRAHV